MILSIVYWVAVFIMWLFFCFVNVVCDRELEVGEAIIMLAVAAIPVVNVVFFVSSIYALLTSKAAQAFYKIRIIG